MMDSDYKAILEKAKSDLLQTQNELGDTYKQQETLEKKITALRATIAALARMLDEEFVEEDAMGLTDAIREAFRAAGPSGNLTPTEVKGKLEMMGYNTAKYGNVMASVHTIINRLVNKGEIKQAGTRPDNKPCYAIAPRMNALVDYVQAGKKK
jgi:hypothetical protein